MNKKIIIFCCISMSLLGVQTRADEFNKVPSSSKWLNNYEVLYSYDGSFTDGFAVNAKTHKVVNGVKAPEKFVSFPVNPSGAVNLTYSPDSTKLAFTRNNDLYVVDIASKQETRLTNDRWH
jgi:Tol biopolymer transport system component